jgi:hypothetical protein
VAQAVQTLGAKLAPEQGAPGKETGLDATVAWVAATYPDIDLDSPPTYPVSAGTGPTPEPAPLPAAHERSASRNLPAPAPI